MAIIDSAAFAWGRGPLLLARCLASACFLGVVCAHGAEDFNRIAPKAVPAQPATTSMAPNQTQIQGGDPNQVLVQDLKALVFVPNPQAVGKGLVRARGVDLRSVTPPAPERFQATVSPYLGQTVTRGKLNELVQSIILFYRGHGRPVVDVVVPAQDITNGVLQIVLLEGRVGKVTATGNRWFSNEEITDGVFIQPGGPIDSRALQGDLDFLNQNPFRTTELIYRPGEKMGQTDLNLQTHDRFPLRVFAGYEDSGDVETGRDRYLAGVNYGDFLGLGQQLNYQYTTSGDGESLRAHSGSYVIPLPWQHTLTFFGSYVDTKGVIPPLIGIRGESYQISGRYSVPLPTFTVGPVVYKETAASGFDYKYNRDSLEFGNTPAANTLYDVDQFVLTYNSAENDPYGQTTLSDSLYVSPGDWGGNNNDTAFSATHGGAVSGYVYNTLVAERLTRLPADWSLILRGTVQSSNSNLAPSEQLGFGGYDTVRGYDEREVNTDDGFIFTTELRTPTIGVGDFLHYPWLKDQLQFLGFWDYGDGSNHNLLPGEPQEIPLSSVGVGLRYTINTYLSIRYDYAFQLLRTGLDNDHGSRSDIGLVISY